MKKCFLALLLLASTNLEASLLIYEMYAYGGNSGARDNNDFLVIYNSGGSAASLISYSLQYESAAGST